MSLLFSSGGGRLGNQILNLIHLTAFAYEYKISIFKVNDFFIESKNSSFIYKIQRNKTNWKIVNNIEDYNFLRRLFLKLFILLIHLYFKINPFKRSYKIGFKRTLPKFILGTFLKKDNSLSKIICDAEKLGVVVCGWGLRDWQLVRKHKKKIAENILNGLKNSIDISNLYYRDYLLVHIRRTDFLKVKEFKALNFSDSIWLNSILRICKNSSIKKVVLFSDDKINKKFISSLEKSGLEVLQPEIIDRSNIDFFEVFVNYISNASLVISNSSTLALGISFLFHESIYIPCKNNTYKEIKMDEAHLTKPISLTWN